MSYNNYQLYKNRPWKDNPRDYEKKREIVEWLKELTNSSEKDFPVSEHDRHPD